MTLLDGCQQAESCVRGRRAAGSPKAPRCALSPTSPTYRRLSNVSDEGHRRCQREGEGGTTPDDGIRPHAAAVASDNAVHDGEANPGAGKVRHRMQPLKDAKEALRIGGIEAGTVVLDEVDPF
jgi:hypothetical protein